MRKATDCGLGRCREDCQKIMDDFLADVRYVRGQYDEDESYENLSKQLSEKVHRLSWL